MAGIGVVRAGKVRTIRVRFADLNYPIDLANAVNEALMGVLIVEHKLVDRALPFNDVAFTGNAVGKMKDHLAFPEFHISVVNIFPFDRPRELIRVNDNFAVAITRALRRYPPGVDNIARPHLPYARGGSREEEFRD